MSPSLVLVIALIGISFAGPLVRLSASPPLTIAIWRLAFSLVIVGAFLLGTGGWRQWKRLDRKGFLLACGAGLMLALHFWSWNASIGLTTVSASVVLVNLQPVIVGLLSVSWLREPPSRRQWTGIGVAMVGAVMVALPDFLNRDGSAIGGRALLGDALAVIGAITAAIYFVTGRRLRATMDLWPYVALVYGACLVALVIFALMVHAPILGAPPREMAIFAGLAIGPMLLGHTGFNWALKYVPAYVVNITLLGEPVGATILAAALPWIHEMPSLMTIAGGVVILTGIYVTARRLPPAQTVGRD
jgi:drug/metabolite transporter (DMT)-like permease